MKRCIICHNLHTLTYTCEHCWSKFNLSELNRKYNDIIIYENHDTYVNGFINYIKEFNRKNIIKSLLEEKQ